MRFSTNKMAMACALFSALLYAICVPFAKILGNHVPSAMLGGLLYWGAGLGLLVTLIVKQGKPDLSLTKKELPFTVAMVSLDITAIILLIVIRDTQNS